MLSWPDIVTAFQHCFSIDNARGLAFGVTPYFPRPTCCPGARCLSIPTHLRSWRFCPSPSGILRARTGERTLCARSLSPGSYERCDAAQCHFTQQRAAGYAQPMASTLAYWSVTLWLVPYITVYHSDSGYFRTVPSACFQTQILLLTVILNLGSFVIFIVFDEAHTRAIRSHGQSNRIYFAGRFHGMHARRRPCSLYRPLRLGLDGSPLPWI